MPGPNKRALAAKIKELRATNLAQTDEGRLFVDSIIGLATDAWEDGFLTGVANLPRTNPFSAAAAPQKKAKR